MTKRLMSSFLAMFLAIAIIPTINSKAAAVKEVYNRQAALQYASKHWNDGKGLCAEFVSDCLKAGGLAKTYQRRVVNLYNALVNNDCGKVYTLTLSNNSIPVGANKGKIEAGDPIFFCNNCKEFTHVSLCSGFGSNGYVSEYAHNDAKNNTRVYTYPHCGSFNWTLYSINMNDTEKLYDQAIEKKEQKPQIISTINLNGGLYLRWEATEGASYYRVYRRTAKSAWKFLANTTSTVYTDETVQNGVEYIYTVRACNGRVFGTKYPSVKKLYVDIVKFTSVKNANNKIYLKWNQNKKATGYIIYKQENNGKWKLLTEIKNGKALSYTDKAVKSGNVYSYRIRAVMGKTTSSYDAKGITTRCLFAPVLKTIVNLNDGVGISFSQVKGADSYRIYRKGTGDESWSYLATTDKSYYIDKNVKSGEYYRYTVRSAKGKVMGSYDSEGLVIKCLATPEITGASFKNDVVRLSWNPVAGAKTYIVYHKAENSSTWKRIAALGNATAFYDSVPEAGDTYYYTVKAVYGNTESMYNTGFKCICDESLGVQVME